MPGGVLGRPTSGFPALPSQTTNRRFHASCKAEGLPKTLTRSLIMGLCVHRKGHSPPGGSPGKGPLASRAFSTAVRRRGVRESGQERQLELATTLPPMARRTVSVSL